MNSTPSKVIPHKIGFIGSGNMAEALIGGLIAKGTSSLDKICSSNPSQGRLDLFKSRFGISTFGGKGSNLEVVKWAQILVLAVKPHLLDGVLEEIKDHLTPEHLVLSIAAGYTIERMQQKIGKNHRIVRAVPNTPSMVGAGSTAYSLSEGASEQDSETVKIFMEAVGIAFEIKESLLDAVTGLSGSGPAYVYMFIEGLADGGVK